MAYQGYSDQPAQGQQGGYGQYNPYGNPSPYSQQGNPYASEDPYRSGQYDAPGQRPGAQQQGSSRYDEERAQGGYEMGQINGSDPNRILNECRQIDREVDNLEAQQARIPQLTDAFINDPGSNSPYKTQLDQQVEALIEGYRALVQRTKRLKSDKESGSPRNAPQVGKTDRRVRSAMNAFQRAERDSRDKMQDSAARQYRIVRPDASDAEVREAMEDSGGQIFSQTLMQGNRRGEALSVQRNVRERHDAIQKIEQDMIALAGLFTDLDALVVQQEAPVAQIEQRGEEVTEHVAKANTELDGAVKKARAARKKKWICLGIGVLIVIIIVVVVVVVVEVTKH